MKHNIPLDSERFNKIIVWAWTPIMVLLLLFLLGAYWFKIESSYMEPLYWVGPLIFVLTVLGFWLVFPALIINILLGSQVKNDLLLKRWNHPWVALILVGAVIVILYLIPSR